MVLYCAADLLWATRIKSTADALGVPCRPARTVEMLEARLIDSPVRALLVDLEAGENALALIRRLRRARTSEPASLTTTQSGGASVETVRIVAWAPHVNVAGLQEAKALGADAVMARGAFSRSLPGLLAALNAGNAVASDLHD